MDWLKGLLQRLPLEKISDILGEIVIWWSQMVQGVPTADLPMYAYLGGSIIVLLLWLLVARMLPRPLGGMSFVHKLYFRLDHFMGCRVGLFLYSTQKPGGSADFMNYCIIR